MTSFFKSFSLKYLVLGLMTGRDRISHWCFDSRLTISRCITVLWLFVSCGEGDRSSAHLLVAAGQGSQYVKMLDTVKAQRHFWVTYRTAVHAIGTYWHIFAHIGTLCTAVNDASFQCDEDDDGDHRTKLTETAWGQRQSQRNDRNSAGSARLWHPGGAVGPSIEFLQNWGSTARQSKAAKRDRRDR